MQKVIEISQYDWTNSTIAHAHGSIIPVVGSMQPSKSIPKNAAWLLKEKPRPRLCCSQNGSALQKLDRLFCQPTDAPLIGEMGFLSWP